MSVDEPSAIPEPAVRAERRGRLGLLTLNRPRSINALTHEMVRLTTRALREWRDDDAIETVAVVGAGDRGLCAGGDIAALHAAATSGHHERTEAFLRDEYAMNALVSEYPKPYVAFMDGLVLGGGIGISAHGSHRVVTERTRAGMPETGIGAVPDVGGTWLLSRAPGELGTMLALTSGFATGADAILLGLADRFAPSSSLGAMIDALADDGVDAALAHGTAPPEAPLAAQREWIDRVFAGDDLHGIVQRLADEPGPDAEAAHALVASRSPLALAATLRALRTARSLPDLRAALRMEYRAATHAFRRPDFIEGVRALIIDKDKDPRWAPARLDDVTDDAVEAFFAAGPSGELELPAPDERHTSS
ncbi:enoyl-CoA hydratase/isomerase family protein [Microbacterium sp. No. 7]|uniref:enoyl-CoA hydratase/isomerase family protein n=1 Tax=Microbacterium sp. No. 7 TaxID=1714373 RepID=UPI0006D267F4|nr:enoyl-CoA hydratase/isomerase family protein [Microbacterium sp. No. 7]ALJ21886.1 3-hydroxyisobutyryl-CoA hydrolase [Microbacterium sp. No. 7]